MLIKRCQITKVTFYSISWWGWTALFAISAVLMWSALAMRRVTEYKPEP